MVGVEAVGVAVAAVVGAEAAGASEVVASGAASAAASSAKPKWLRFAKKHIRRAAPALWPDFGVVVGPRLRLGNGREPAQSSGRFPLP